MNTKHSVNALSGKRSLLRRFVTVATAASVLMLGVVAQADGGGGGKGSFELMTIAGVGDSYTGKLDVKGDGKFSVTEEGGNLVFTSKVGDGELNMKDGRQKHTVGDDSKLGLKKGHKVSSPSRRASSPSPTLAKRRAAASPASSPCSAKTRTSR